MSTPTLAVLKTYRYLRVSIVAMALLLAIALVVEISAGESVVLLGSISEYYYSPVRNVLVGALMAIGLSLVAVKGREGAEDVMLNLAGMLAPIAAVVPLPVEGAIPAAFVPGVENNVTALLVLGLVGLVFAAWTARGGVAAYGRAVLVGAVGWLVLTAWFVLGRDSFLSGAHYATAVPMFGLIAGTALVNARHARERTAIPGMSPSSYARSYAVIALGIFGTVLAAGLFFLLSLVGFEPVASWIFWVEALLLTLFAAFWILQTMENWYDGTPP